MQSLLPQGLGRVDASDLEALYAFPDGPAWVRAIFVSTLDGAAQGADHRSGSLSSRADQQVFALQRSLCDVVLAGAGTTRAEGYRPVHAEEIDADVRRRHGLASIPGIAVVSRSLDLDPALLGGAGARTIVVTTSDAPADKRELCAATADVVVAGEHRVDLTAAVEALVERGHRRILCEGGPTLMRDLVAAGRLDDLCLTLTPELAAGDRLRILHGDSIDPPARMTLAHLLEEDGELFARYVRTERHETGPGV